jgi:biotin carboxyl carrier protein
MEFEYLVDGTLRKVGIERQGAGWTVRAGGEAGGLEIRRISEHELVLLDGDRVHRAQIARDGDRLFVRIDGREVLLSEPGERDGRGAGGESGASGAGRRIIAPMPGKVIKVCVAVGDAVRKNQTLVIVEAMKMENEIKAAADGVVAKILATAGELVDSERTLVELEPSGPDKEASHG